MLRTFLACAALAVLVSSFRAEPAGAEPVRATIRGAEAVNVRRGPGPNTAAVVALRRGASVRVEERVGQWALVVLDSGERGYVNAAYLEVEAGAAIPTAVPAAAGEATPPPDATPEPTATGEMAAPPALDRELAALRERLATLEAHVDHGGAAAGATPALPVEQPPAVAVPTVVEPPVRLDVGPSLALAGVGFLVGFLFGTLYGQRQERNRRLRVRF